MSKELVVKPHIHLLEIIAERNEGMIDVLEDDDALGPDFLAAYGSHLADEKIRILAAHDMRILHYPFRNLKKASRV